MFLCGGYDIIMWCEQCVLHGRCNITLYGGLSFTVRCGRGYRGDRLTRALNLEEKLHKFVKGYIQKTLTLSLTYVSDFKDRLSIS